MNSRSVESHRASTLALRIACFIVTVALGACGTDLPPDVARALEHVPDTVDFNFDVRPILSDKCFACHGPDARGRKAGLRLDVRDSALAELPESPGKHAIVPGDPARSELFHRVVSNDPELRMPAKASNKTLTAMDVAVLVRWIEQGAPYAPHWAFIEPREPALPAGPVAGGNEIDRFIQARLQRQGLEPAPLADRETLINRVSFDLTGLPPSDEEIRAFVADTRPDAYERVVDRLLASPRYGERMASYWMDVARFADTDGYQGDGERRLFPWRDWVIDAFNRNLPYDDFVTWQLAGDLLPNATREQRIATAFNRLHRRNTEQGIDPEEYRVEYVIDRTNTFGKAFLGLTLECARCHDHKYDPISQKAYYQIYAFFNSTNENGLYIDAPFVRGGVASGAAMSLPTEDQERALGQAERAIDQQHARVASAVSAAEPAVARWLGEISGRPQTLRRQLAQSIRQATVAHYAFDGVTGRAKGGPMMEPAFLTPDSLDPSKQARAREPIWKKGVRGKAFFIGDYSSVSLPLGVGRFDHTDPFSIDLWVYPDERYPSATVLLESNLERQGHRGYNLYLKDNRLRFMMSHAWPNDYLEVISEEALPEKRWSHVTLTYSGSGKASGVGLYIDGTPAHVSTLRDWLTRSSAVDETPTPFFGHPGLTLGVRRQVAHMRGGGLDELRIFGRKLSDLEVLFLHDPARAASVASRANDANEHALLNAHATERQPSVLEALKALQESRAALVKLYDAIPEIMVMGDVPEKRQAYILKRGVFSNHGEPVEPAALESVLPFDAALPRNRLGLARWLVSKQNPLTARVFVNRLWQLHFGRGLVDTAADFGAQGTPPSHPELLDWLAMQFIESGWDIKAMNKRIVMSAAYRRSSDTSPQSLKADLGNIWLARGPRFRLSAEMIRDNALAVSGLLVERVGGESQYPYQPVGYAESAPGIPRRYPAPDKVGDGLYRRSLYTHWSRGSPPPFMMIFDKTEADVCTVNRVVTNSPLQALALLNDTQFVEASRVLAQNVAKQYTDTTQRLKHVFYSFIRRDPDDEELGKLRSFYDAEVKRFRDAPRAAHAYLNVGEAPFDSSLDEADTAALAIMASVVMNTPEAYTKR